MTFASPEDKFGIKLRSRRTLSLEQNTAMIMGSIYLVGGIIGFFFTGFSNITEVTNKAVFGIFMVNPYHNIVHVAVGLLWLMGAFALTQAGTEGLNIAIGGVYILATVLGFLGYLYLLNIPTYGGDNYLHLVSGTIPLIFGSGLLRAFGGREASTA
ncbi:MAG: DUF4383 domain-containing protein [Pseudonocardiaceae bacterium]